MKLFTDIFDSFRRPEFWFYSSWLDILTKYRRTRFGLWWALIPTAVFVVALGSVYGQLMSLELDFYIPFLCMGYMLWRFLTHVLTDSGGVFRAHLAYIQQGRVNLVDYLFRVFAKALFYFVVSIPVLIAVFAWSTSAEMLDLWTMLVTLPLFALCVFVIGGHVAFLAARFPDITELINTVLIFGFLLTPILWHPSQAPGGRVLSWLMKSNPAFHLLEVVRQPALGHMPETFTLAYLAVFLSIGLISMTYIYQKLVKRVPFWT